MEQWGTSRPTRAVIDSRAIEDNVRFFLSRLSPGTELMAVVKADGYGHGALRVARAALAAGATWLGVATAEEGVALRGQGISAPILILGASWGEQVKLAVEADLDVTVFHPDALRETAEAARRAKRAVRVHLKVDTGMGRVGIQPEELDADWLERLRSTPVVWQGLMTHLAESEAPDPGFTREQVSRFLDVVDKIRRLAALPPCLHVANSAAAVRFPGTHFNLVRVGLGLYGLKAHPAMAPLVPALGLQSRVVHVKQVPAGFAVGYGRTYRTPGPLQIATVPVGYADGYRRGLSNRAEVLVRGRRYPVVGVVSMDQLTVAVPLDHPVQRGDVVTLIGRDGDEEISASELAATLGTIPYEIVTGLGHRVPRVDAGPR